jgi:Ni/Co efflux regulator RcnB
VIELPVTMIVWGPQLWKPNMRKLITTIALLAMVDTSVAIAQTAGSRNPSAHRSTNSKQQLLPGDAPAGHRQPRADQVPSEKNLMDDPNDSINRENAQLDRMTKGICRGC